MSVLHDCQAPAPAGQFPGDGHDADGGAFTASVQVHPALVQAPVAPFGALPDWGGDVVEAGLETGAGAAIGTAVVPGGLHQEPSGMGVAGLGDASLAALAAGRVLAGTSPR